MKWLAVLDDIDRRHVVPSLDTWPHVLAYDCPCMPGICPMTTSKLIVHNSFDGREASDPNFWGYELIVH